MPLKPFTYYKQWMNYKTVQQPDGSLDKLPMNPATGGVCTAHDPAVWTDYATAVATGLPVAFVFTENDPFFFLDLDGCRDPQTGIWNEVAASMFAAFPGCAAEVSVSGTGGHIFGRIPTALDHGCDNKQIHSQFYTEKRFVALTGIGAIGSAWHMPDAATYQWLIDSYFQPGALPGGGSVDGFWTFEPDPEWDGPEDDNELIAKALASRSARSTMGGGASFKDLWEANADVLGRIWPDDKGNQNRAFDHSEAEQALAFHLAFWTGKDCVRMERIFLTAPLTQRPKAQDREPYRIDTLSKAAAGCTKVYIQKKPKPKPAEAADPQAPASADGHRDGYQFLTPQDQTTYFKGCAYVRDGHRIFVPDGCLLKPEQFKATYGGRVFAMDSIGDKVSKNAYEVFTESQAVEFPKVHTVCFRPEIQPGAIVQEEGFSLVNTYVPAGVTATPGDASPFLGLLASLLPDTVDQSIILAYMAACVQYPGVKFQWCPLLQGVFGNGKSFLATALGKAVGERYTHLVDPKDIGNVFNAWIEGKLLAIIEEIYVRGKTELIDSLKPLITNSRVPIQGKGLNQGTGDNRANFFLTSNYKDAIIKTKDDRRYSVFYTAQQSWADIVRDGMAGNYFPELYAWAKNGGYGIITHYLGTYAIPDALNPAGQCHRAPDSSSTAEVIEQSRGYVEQKLIEACEEGQAGFAGGWISSMALDKFLDTVRTRVPLNKRKEMLADLGYVPHPGLVGGRVNNIIMQENGKPRLFVKAGHLAANVTAPADIARRYQEAQGYMVTPGQPGATAGGVV